MLWRKLSWTWLWNKGIAWTEDILYVQLFITFFSLPILLCWGLPISMLTIVGNVIFSPCILVFLFLSTLLFFAQLCGIPSYWVAMTLELVTTWWLKVIALGSKQVLVAVPRPALLVAMLLPLIPVVLVYSPWGGNKRLVITVLLGFLCGFTLLLKGLVPSQGILEVPWSDSQKIWIAYDHQHTCLVDVNGVIRHRLNIKSWVDFTLKPLLSKQLGIMECDVVVQFCPSFKRTQATCELAKAIGAKVIVFAGKQVPIDACCSKGLHCIRMDPENLKECAPEKGLANLKFLVETDIL